MQIRIVEFPSRSILISVLHSVYTSYEQTIRIDPDVSNVKIKQKPEKDSYIQWPKVSNMTETRKPMTETALHVEKIPPILATMFQNSDLRRCARQAFHALENVRDSFSRDLMSLFARRMGALFTSYKLVCGQIYVSWTSSFSDYVDWFSPEQVRKLKWSLTLWSAHDGFKGAIRSTEGQGRHESPLSWDVYEIELSCHGFVYYCLVCELARTLVVTAEPSSEARRAKSKER